MIEEDLNENQFTKEEIQKLDLIRSKVSDLLKRTQPSSQAPVKSNQPITQSAIAPVQQIVESFDSFMLNEMIRKRGKKSVVLDKSGKKVLGTHSSRKQAVKQLQAIEISKQQHK